MAEDQLPTKVKVIPIVNTVPDTDRSAVPRTPLTALEGQSGDVTLTGPTPEAPDRQLSDQKPGGFVGGVSVGKVE